MLNPAQRKALPGLALMSLLFLSCTSSEPLAQAVDDPEESQITEPVELDLVACPDEELIIDNNSTPDPVDYLVDTESWWRVIEFDLDDFDNPDFWTYLPIVAEPISSPGPDKELNIRLLSQAHDLFQFASTEDLPLFVGLRETPGGMVELEEIDGRATITFIEDQDGTPIFGGGCSMRFLGGEIDLKYDGEPEDLVDDLLSATGEDLARLVLPGNLSR